MTIFYTLSLISLLFSSFLFPTLSLFHYKGTNKPIGFSSTLITRSPFHNPNLSYIEQVQMAVHRSFNRYHYLQSKLLKRITTHDVQSYTLWDHGDYNMAYLIGTPASVRYAMLDTGSELTWLQCLPCEPCFKQTAPIFDPAKSSSFRKLSCDDSNCKMISSRNCRGTGSCSYFIDYEDASLSHGELAIETLTFKGDNSSQLVTIDFVIGCGHNNSLFEMGPDAPGIIGLSRSPGSFVSQLEYKKFSYCFSPSKISPGIINFGKNAEIVGSKTTLLNSGFDEDFYYLSLEGISVNGSMLPIPPGTFNLRDDGHGGIIIDSGSTFSFLNDTALKLLAEAAGKFIEPVDDPFRQFDLCFVGNSDDLQKTPIIIFHFTGADWKLDPERSWIYRGYGVYCLAMFPSRSDSSIFGTYQQIDFNVGYDLENDILSFEPRQCAII